MVLFVCVAVAMVALGAIYLSNARGLGRRYDDLVDAVTPAARGYADYKREVKSTKKYYRFRMFNSILATLILICGLTFLIQLAFT